MKAIIPVAGAGTKLRPHTYTQPKALIPMAGKTILSVIVDSLIENGVDDFIFIIGYLGDKIKNYVEKQYPNLKVSFINQNDRKGTGHAIWLTKDLVQNSPVMIVYGDTITDFDIKDIIDSPTSQIGLRRVDSPVKFGVAEVNEKDEVIKVVEKPKIPKSNLAIVGVYKIIETEQLFRLAEEYLNQPIGSEDGEYHLTHIIQMMINEGTVFQGFRVSKWFDCGQKEALLETNATLLKTMRNRVADSTEYTAENSVIIPPVSIGKGCIIKESIIGPDVSIGENTTIQSSIVQDSIIGAYAELNKVVLKKSIIGSDAYVHGLYQSLNIGDNTEIDL